MTEKNINILLVEDHEFTRMGLSMTIKTIPNLNLVAEATDGQEAIIMAQEQSRCYSYGYRIAKNRRNHGD